ncbi:hypothetical protein [Mangrovibacterium lignilyticum]|uniref:hypothetical protein n=1 Tax=Mangrovibacterium lignilyticum TaxID=2668052 RepID=UPI0013D1FBFC|nr:hypothetical protein [Mangrovibacterium lignilyticum]
MKVVSQIFIVKSLIGVLNNNYLWNKIEKRSQGKTSTFPSLKKGAALETKRKVFPNYTLSETASIYPKLLTYFQNNYVSIFLFVNFFTYNFKKRDGTVYKEIDDA